MIAEELEFQISQYADGTLSAADRPGVDAALAADPEARRTLAEYRRLDAHLTRHAPRLGSSPDLKWDRLADHLSRHIDRSAAQDSLATAPLIAGRIGMGFPTMRSWGLRAAAAVLIVATGSLLLHYRAAPTNPMTPPAGTSDVTGPQADVAAGPPVTDIQIGPSELAARNDAARFGQADRSSPKAIVGLTPTGKGDSHLH
jgi:anti-sigma factor RsiW